MRPRARPRGLLPPASPSRRRRRIPCWWRRATSRCNPDSDCGPPTTVAPGRWTPRSGPLPRASTRRTSSTRIDPLHVLVLGDIQYEDGAPREFNVSYEDSWGRAVDQESDEARAREPRVRRGEREQPGDIDVDPNATGYFTYFADQLAAEGADAGDPQKGWYSFDVPVGGTKWHVVALNSECAAGLRTTGGLGGRLRLRAPSRSAGCAPTWRPTAATARSPTGTTRASARAASASSSIMAPDLERPATPTTPTRARRARPQLRALRPGGADRRARAGPRDPQLGGRHRRQEPARDAAIAAARPPRIACQHHPRRAQADPARPGGRAIPRAGTSGSSWTTGSPARPRSPTRARATAWEPPPPAAGQARSPSRRSLRPSSRRSLSRARLSRRRFRVGSAAR